MNFDYKPPVQLRVAFFFGQDCLRTYSHDDVGNIGSKDTEHGLYQYGYDKT